jgi:hypothetical protein
MPDLVVNLARNPYVTFGVLAAALLVGVVWAARVWRDLREQAEEETDTPEDLVTSLTKAYASGQMSEEEYRRIRQSLGLPVRSDGPRATSPAASTSPPLPEPTEAAPPAPPVDPPKC